MLLLLRTYASYAAAQAYANLCCRDARMILVCRSCDGFVNAVVVVVCCCSAIVWELTAMRCHAVGVIMASRKMENQFLLFVVKYVAGFPTLLSHFRAMHFDFRSNEDSVRWHSHSHAENQRENTVNYVENRKYLWFSMNKKEKNINNIFSLMRLCSICVICKEMNDHWS